MLWKEGLGRWNRDSWGKARSHHSVQRPHFTRQGMEVAQRGEAPCLRSHSSSQQQLACHLPALSPASSPIAPLLPTMTPGESGWRA